MIAPSLPPLQNLSMHIPHPLTPPPRPPHKMPQTNTPPVLRIIKPTSPLPPQPPIPLLHLGPRPLPNLILDELAPSHRQARREHAREVVRCVREVRLVEPEEEGG